MKTKENTKKKANNLYLPQKKKKHQHQHNKTKTVHETGFDVISEVCDRNNGDATSRVIISLSCKGHWSRFQHQTEDSLIKCVYKIIHPKPPPPPPPQK